MKTIKLLIVSLVVLMASCSTPKLGYFQDVESGQVEQLPAAQIIRIQPGDKLSILVSSKNPELAYLYNLPVVSHYQSATSGKGLTTGTVAHYTVNPDGTIDFPILGSINIQGMSRADVASEIKNRLVNGNHIKDAEVTVDFLDMYVEVMGEVKNPGRFIIDHDKVTLIEALSKAGDLTIYGKRDNVLVVRENNGKQMSYRVDLTDAKSLYNSPAFYLQQNDMVYVEPNARRARESSTTGNTFYQPSIWISMASLLTSILVLIVK
jgi:polysaccharide export outer membrane protein